MSEPPSGASPPPLLVTGANGHLGRRLIEWLCGERSVRAVVRSERAAATLRALPAHGHPGALEIRVVDYADVDALAEAARGCSEAVHLVGILKEAPGTSYEDAHEGTCRALAVAAGRAGIQKILLLSILGSRPDSPNPCLASKGRAEQILIDAPVPALILRVPMVLGPDDLASRALRGQATAPFLVLVGGGRTWQQPIDAADVIQAILAGLANPELRDRALDLAGPEPVPHRELVARAAAVLSRRPPPVIPVPLGLARLAVAILERVSSSPPVTSAMLGVLQHDDRIDPEPARKALSIELTPLDHTLTRCLGPVEAIGPGAGKETP